MGWRDDDYDDDLDIRSRRSLPRGNERDDGPRRQSGVGIVSLVISIIVAIELVAAIFGVFVLALENGGGDKPVNEVDPMALFLFAAILGGLGIALVGLILGVLGTMQPRTSPICAILGIVFNALILIGFGGFMCMGIALG